LNFCLVATRVLLCSALLWVNTSLAEVQSQPSHIQLISHPSVNTATLDKDQVRRIFTMYQTNWSDSQPIVVYVLSQKNSTHQLFSRQILGLFPYQLERIWNKLVYSGLGEGPIKVNNEQEMLENGFT
jgi:ABC-type phosphate transport system substrate-binding protein